MIKLQIPKQYIEIAKTQTVEFDSIKVYEKLQCKSNWIGRLGEIMFASWLTNKDISFDEVPFVKKGFEDPDLIVNGKSIDVKTTFDTKMWLQKPKHDLYIFCRVNEEADSFYIVGYITKKEIEEKIARNNILIKEREERKDYIVLVSELAETDLLEKELR